MAKVSLGTAGLGGGCALVPTLQDSKNDAANRAVDRAMTSLPLPGVRCEDFSFHAAHPADTGQLLQRDPETVFPAR